MNNLKKVTFDNILHPDLFTELFLHELYYIIIIILYYYMNLKRTSQLTAMFTYKEQGNSCLSIECHLINKTGDSV